MIIKFEGHSDDIVYWEVVGSKERGEIGCYQSGKDLHHCTIRVTSYMKAVKVHAIYDGCWSFAVGLVDEGAELPDWSYKVTAGHAYSVSLQIDTGADDATAVKEDSDG